MLYAEIPVSYCIGVQNTSIVTSDTLLLHYMLHSHIASCLEYKYCYTIFVK